MNGEHIPNEECRRAVERMDLLLDGELPAAEREVLERHLAECPACRAELEQRREVRRMLRQAVRNQPAPADLDAGIRRRLWDGEREPNAAISRRRWMLAIAAMVLLAVAGWMALDHRTPAAIGRAEQDGRIDALLAKVAGIYRPGLSDHMFCAYYRNSPVISGRAPDDPRNLGVEYEPLKAIVAAHTPPGARLQAVHQCSYRGRRYVHLILVTRSGPASVVVSLKNAGEEFGPPPEPGAEVPVHETGADGFQVAGFDCGRHLVYVVSEMDAEQNRQLAASLAPEMSAFLRQL